MSVTDLNVARAAKAEKAEAVVRVDPDQYAQATCGLPGCGADLYITWTSSRAVYLSDTVTDLADPTGAHSSSWEVGCGNGHTTVLPPDTAVDSYTFGECGCEPDDIDPDCGHNDMARLRRVVA